MFATDPPNHLWSPLHVPDVTNYRANYALVTFQEHLGPDEAGLDVPWADFAGDSTQTRGFEVPTDDPTEPYVEMQVYEVGTYGHDLLINGEPLSGFDAPTCDGWQYWMDTITAARLTEGRNEIRFRRETESDDSFVVGSATVHWKEPVEI